MGGDMNVQPASDDQELAKVLAGVDEQANQIETTDASAPADTPSGLQFEETPLATPPTDDNQTTANDPSLTASIINPVENEEPIPTIVPTEVTTPEVAPEEPTAVVSTPEPVTTLSTDNDLETVKKDALEELRPLVTKLDLPADEKFDTMLLIIRSTDDKSLVQPAHEIAKTITDEKKRAEALLDIIKEIDYFSNQAK